jgi:hypothetical protein
MKKLIVLTALFAMVLGGTAIAADWNFYGSSRMALFSNMQDKDLAANPLTNGDNTTTSFAQQGNSRIGANVAAGDVKGRFEYGTGINLRLLYGTWNFGSGEMSVGQMYNPTYYGMSNQVYDGDNGLAGFGAPFSRLDAIEFKFGGFKIAAVEPSLTAATGASTTTYTYPATGVTAATTGYNNARVVLPKIELAYNGAFGPVNLHVSGGWNSVDFYNTADNTISVTSMVGQVMAKYSGGPFMIGGSALYGVNLGNYGWNVGPAGAATGVVVGTEVKDTTTMGFTLVAGFTFSDMVGIEAGYGYSVNSYDASVSSNDDPAQSFYVQVPLTLADGVFIVPEVGIFDYMENAAKAKEGSITYLGAKFQINF